MSPKRLRTLGRPTSGKSLLFTSLHVCGTSVLLRVRHTPLPRQQLACDRIYRHPTILPFCSVHTEWDFKTSLSSVGVVPYAALLFSEWQAFLLFLQEILWLSLILYPSGRNPALLEKCEPTYSRRMSLSHLQNSGLFLTRNRSVSACFIAAGGQLRTVVDWHIFSCPDLGFF